MHIETFPVPQIKSARSGTARLRVLLNRLGDWYVCARSRRHLAELDGHMLKDIGLSEADRRRECARPCWRASEVSR
jgi:uncharacterized protein YjiS (DUF1127 family)